MIVQSFGALQAFTPPIPQWRYGGTNIGAIDLYGATLESYASIWRTQPNVRTVVEFVARNIAQLGVHVYRRVSDTDRVRLANHPVAQWLAAPNPWTTRYRLIESLVQDLGIYFNAYWIKVHLVDGNIGLLRIPPECIQAEGGLYPTAYVWTGYDGQRVAFAPTDLVTFTGYNPRNPLAGLSPLETLRRVLAEESAAGNHREAFWRNSARFEGVIERPLAAKTWTATQKQSWREQWQTQFAQGGAGAGAVAVLEDGMAFKPMSWSAKDAEFLGARKLCREECAAAYHVPLPMVGILDHATFSNIVEQHKNLYQDCLGPWLEWIEEELERQLLPEATDTANVYLEFNIADKMKGSFEEQAASIQALVGRPVMTANEGRARLNLPRIIDDPSADQLAPQQGGPSTSVATVSAPTDSGVAKVVAWHQWRQVARLKKLAPVDRPAAFQASAARWQRELETDLAPLFPEAGAAAAAAARVLAESAVVTTLTSLHHEATHEW